HCLRRLRRAVVEFVTVGGDGNRILWADLKVDGQRTHAATYRKRRRLRQSSGQGRPCDGRRSTAIGFNCLHLDPVLASPRMPGDGKFTSIDDVIERFGRQQYICNRRIATVVYLASHLEKPILVEGPAGVGKTELAKVLAGALGYELI